jgi:hypothetical protein
MRRTVFAFVVAGLALAAVPASQAAPIAPLGSGVTTGSNVTQVWWRHHHHCWIGRYGHRHCRWW